MKAPPRGPASPLTQLEPIFRGNSVLLGPTIEILIDKLWGRAVLPVGPSLYRMGLTFSVGLALFPTLIMMIALVGWFVARVVGG